MTWQYFVPLYLYTGFTVGYTLRDLGVSIGTMFQWLFVLFFWPILALFVVFSLLLGPMDGGDE